MTAPQERKVPACRGSGPVVCDCLIKGLGMSSRVSVTRHIRGPLPLVKKSRASCSDGRFIPGFTHQKSSPGLNNL